MNSKKVTAIAIAAYISGSAAIFPGNLSFGEFLKDSVQQNFYHKAAAQEVEEDTAAALKKENEKLLEDARETRKQMQEVLKALKEKNAEQNVRQEPLPQLPEVEDTYRQNEQNGYVDGNLEDATRFDYDPGSTYQVYCRPGFTTDVQLAPGEKVLKITAGDKINWEYRYMADRNGYHLYISPTQMGLETNLIIITDKHNYQLTLATSKQFYPIVMWNYPQEFYDVQDDKNIVMEVKSVDQLDFKYNVSRAEEYPWTPECVFDDGFRTFIRLAPGKADKYRPLLMIKKAGRWMLAQYAVKSDAFVVAETFREAMLVMGDGAQRKTVRITKGEI